MDRSLYPQGVEVDQGDLKYGTDQFVFNLLDRFTALGIMGVRTGLTLSVNGSDPSRFDLSAGDGYAANGELVELDTSVIASSLASAVAGARSYVVLFYTETLSLPGAASIGGAPRDRRATRASRVAVLSETAWLSLVPTAADLSLPASDRACLVGVVTAPTTVGGALTAASFSQVAVYTRVLTMPQPSVITGVTVLSVDSAMPITERQTTNPSARLELDYAVVGADYRVRFRPPGSTTYGDWVTVTAGGTFTVYSQPSSAGPFIRIAVTLAMLPTLAATTSVADDLPITALYEGAYGTARLSANDVAHRSQIGAGLPSATNPHGLAYSDLGGESALRGLVLGRGLLNTAAQGTVPRLVFEGQTLGAYTLEEESRIGASAIRRRLYREHATGAAVETINARWDHLTTNWNKDVLGTAASMYRQTASACEVWGRADVDDTPWTTWRSDVSLGSISTIARLNVESTVAALATTLPRHNAPFPVTGAGSRVLVYQSGPSDGAIQGGVLREYRSTGTTGTGNPAGTREITINALWNGSNWQRDQAVPSYKYEYGRGQLIAVLSRSTNGTPWADNNWESMPMALDAATGVLSALDFAYATAQALTKRIQPVEFQATLQTTGVVGASVLIFDWQDPSGNDTVWRFSAGSASGKGFIAPLKLPNGATVTGVRLYGSYDGNGDEIRAAVRRVAHADGVITTMRAGTAYDVIADSGGGAVLGVNDPAPLTIDQNATIDNDTYTYNVWVGTNNNPSVAVAFFYRIEVDYTTTALAGSE